MSHRSVGLLVDVDIKDNFPPGSSTFFFLEQPSESARRKRRMGATLGETGGSCSVSDFHSQLRYFFDLYFCFDVHSLRIFFGSFHKSE